MPQKEFNHEVQAFDSEQIAILKKIALGADLSSTLDDLVRLIESKSDGLCSILILDEDSIHVRHGAAPNLPLDFMKQIDDMEIGPIAGSCGTAAYRGERVIVSDIDTDPLWASYRQLAAPYGLRACWSSPIFSPDRKVLGTFAVYYRSARKPTELEMYWVDAATSLAAIAIAKARGEYALQRAEARRELIFREVADVLYAVNVGSDGRFCFQHVNNAFLKATGLSENQVVGKFVEDVIPASALQPTLENYRTAISERRTVRWDATSIYPAGERTGEVTITPLFTEAGRCDTLLGTVHDITDRQRLEAQLATSQKMESLGLVAGKIAHDFNNILTAILGNLDLAQAKLGAGSKGQRNIEVAQSACLRGAELAKQILEFSRPTISAKSAVNIASIVREVAELLQSSELKGVNVSLDLADSTAGAWGNPTQIHEVVMNLLRNARQALEEHGKIQIRLRSEAISHPSTETISPLAPGQYLRLDIEDNGHGITKAQLAHIFEPFYTTHAQRKGTGLGLAIVHNIVKEHHGSIAVKSTPGNGTIFSVFFPLAPSEAKGKNTKARSYQDA